MSEEAPAAIPVFDGHNDALQRFTADPSAFFRRSDEGHLDVPRAREGGMVGGLFACFVPPLERPEPPADEQRGVGYELPMSRTPDEARAEEVTRTLAATLFRMERASQGRLRVCRSVPEIRAAVDADAMAAVLHIEGAEAIDGDLDALELYHRAGLRSLGLVWSRPNRFGTGVPFRHPADPDIGPGLTDTGKALVRACNELGIVVDLSHLNAAGFRDVARLSDAPLVASHSNAWALCRSSRNLTDDQLAVIRESGGLVGLNFSVTFLREDGWRDRDTPLERMVRHVDHLVEHLGLEGVALGSDFDGATLPRAIGDVTGLPRLVDALRAAGYDDHALRRICFENWLDVLERSWT